MALFMLPRGQKGSAKNGDTAGQYKTCQKEIDQQDRVRLGIFMRYIREAITVQTSGYNTVRGEIGFSRNIQCFYNNPLD